jgi:hypothetical protein
LSYRCPFCNRTFPFTGIKNHLKHCLEDTFPVHVYRRKCLACGREFKSWSGLSGIWSVNRTSSGFTVTC